MSLFPLETRVPKITLRCLLKSLVLLRRGEKGLVLPLSCVTFAVWKRCINCRGKGSCLWAGRIQGAGRVKAPSIWFGIWSAEDNWPGRGSPTPAGNACTGLTFPASMPAEIRLSSSAPLLTQSSLQRHLSFKRWKLLPVLPSWLLAFILCLLAKDNISSSWAAFVILDRSLEWSQLIQFTVFSLTCFLELSSRSDSFPSKIMVNKVWFLWLWVSRLRAEHDVVFLTYENSFWLELEENTLTPLKKNETWSKHACSSETQQFMWQILVLHALRRLLGRPEQCLCSFTDQMWEG